MLPSPFLHSFWRCKKTTLFFNPKDKNEVNRVQKLKSSLFFEEKSGKIWLSTSGTTGKKKWVCLSKGALLASAESVNYTFEIKKKDIWGLALPIFHVGGLSILARAALAGNKVVCLGKKWNPLNVIRHQAITLLSLVPAQVYDLVEKNLLPPPSLRGLFVGGGALTGDLHRRALELGWPIWITYGMTECGSQIAGARVVGGKDLQLMPHLEAKIGPNQCLSFRGPSLFDGYVYENGSEMVFHDPKIEGWFESEDLGSVESGQIKIIGRGSDFVKILGENVSLAALRAQWKAAEALFFSSTPTRLIARESSRKGKDLVIEGEKRCEKLEKAFHFFKTKLPPYLKDIQLEHVEKVPISWKEKEEA